MYEVAGEKALILDAAARYVIGSEKNLLCKEMHWCTFVDKTGKNYRNITALLLDTRLRRPEKNLTQKKLHEKVRILVTGETV